MGELQEILYCKQTTRAPTTYYEPSLHHCPCQPTDGKVLSLPRGVVQILPREQFHIIRTESYSGREEEHVLRVWNWLGVNDLQKDASNRYVRNISAMNQQMDDIGEMLPQTKGFMKEFFREPNSMLVDMLDDPMYYWKE